MRISTTASTPLARLTPCQKLGAGSALAAMGGLVIVLSLMFGWSGLGRPWSFLIGFSGGLLGGTGVALAVCGLVHLARGSASSGQGDAGQH